MAKRDLGQSWGIWDETGFGVTGNLGQTAGFKVKLGFGQPSI